VAAGAMAKGLQKAGHQVVTITSNRNGDGFAEVPEERQEPDGNIVVYCRTRPGRFYYASNLSATIQHYLPQADVVVVPGGSWNYYFFTGCRLARRFQRPYVVRPEGNLSPYALSHKPLRKKIWWALFDKKYFQKAAVVLALTQEEVDQIRGMDITTRIEIITNGINLQEYQEAMSRKQIEQHYPQLKNRRWLLFMSRFHPIKGLDLLLPAFAAIHRNYRDVVLILAGPDESNYRRTVEQMVRDLDLHDSVCFPGMVGGSLKNGLLHHATIFCLTSHSEGLPMGVLEAMACGLPVLITKECRLPEVKEWHTGLVVKRDVKEIAAGLALLLQDDKIRHEMGTNAQRLVQQRFTWDNVCNLTSQLLQEITL
jgi:glycosyltransferase involved in cell wall biosynthesis